MEHQQIAETICRINEAYQLNNSIRKKMAQREGQETADWKMEKFFQFESLDKDYLEKSLELVLKEQGEIMRRFNRLLGK